MSQYAQPGYGYGAAAGGRAVEDGYGHNGGYDAYGAGGGQGQGGYAPEGAYVGAGGEQHQGHYGADGQYEPYSDVSQALHPLDSFPELLFDSFERTKSTNFDKRRG